MSSARPGPIVRQFQSLVGSLLWVERCTHPDIAFALHKVTRLAHASRLVDWKMTKRVALYLNRSAMAQGRNDPRRQLGCGDAPVSVYRSRFCLRQDGPDFNDGRHRDAERDGHQLGCAVSRRRLRVDDGGVVSRSECVRARVARPERDVARNGRGARAPDVVADGQPSGHRADRWRGIVAGGETRGCAP